jgi:hypothetical protein
MQVISTRCREGATLDMHQVVAEHFKLVPHNAKVGISKQNVMVFTRVQWHSCIQVIQICHTSAYEELRLGMKMKIELPFHTSLVQYMPRGPVPHSQQYMALDHR